MFSNAMIDSMNVHSIQQQYSSEELQKYIAEANSGGDFTHWRSIRYFITKAIHKDGTFLDVGCANGFLLRCLLEWSEYDIIPFGIDNRAEVIALAKELLPEYADHFQCVSGDDLDNLERFGLPVKYDFVYRNYWRRNDVGSAEQVKAIVEDLLKHVHDDGRLILGVYWASSHPIGSEEYKNSLRLFHDFISVIKQGAPSPTGEAFSETGFHWVMWVDVANFGLGTTKTSSGVELPPQVLNI